MRPYLQMLVSAMSFAVMGAFAHGARGMCDWQVIALSRSLLAVMLAALLAFASGASLVYFRPRTLWMRSIAGSISVMCNFYALTALPIADGGLMVFLLYEKFRGRPPSPSFQSAATLAGLVLVGLLFAVTFYNDIMRILQ